MLLPLGLALTWVPEAHANPAPDEPLQSLPEEVRKEVEPARPELPDPKTAPKTGKQPLSPTRERGPKIELPKHAQPQPQQGNPTPASPLVPVNKSGVTPQVLKLPEGRGSVQGMGITFKTNLQTGSASLSMNHTRL